MIQGSTSDRSLPGAPGADEHPPRRPQVPPQAQLRTAKTSNHHRDPPVRVNYINEWAAGMVAPCDWSRPPDLIFDPTAATAFAAAAVQPTTS